MAAGEPAGQGGIVDGVGLGVAEDAVTHPPQQGGGHAGRGNMIHIRHPQGQCRGGAAALGGEIPFQGAGAGAVVDDVEGGGGRTGAGVRRGTDAEGGVRARGEGGVEDEGERGHG